MKAYYYIFLFLLSGCSTAYIPSPKNIPLFEKKGEVQAELGISTNSIYATGGYAFSDKYALISNASMSFSNFSKIYDFGPDLPYVEFDILPMPSGFFAHRSIEAGVGHFNRKPSSTWKHEMFTGIGYGAADEGDDWKNRYLQGFVQRNTGKRSKHFEIAWSFRLAGSYFDYKYPFSDYSSGIGQDVIFHKNFGAVHAEHVTLIGFGGKQMKGFVRGGFNIAYPFLSNNDEYKTIWLSRGGYWNFTMFHLSVGLNYRFK